MTANYVLLAEAETDFRAVLRHTRKRWGEAQARSYAAKLKNCIERVATGHGFAKDMSSLYPGLRLMRCEHHFIFCVSRDDETVLVVAIFHERMDLMLRLAKRLT